MKVEVVEGRIEHRGVVKIEVVEGQTKDRGVVGWRGSKVKGERTIYVDVAKSTYQTSTSMSLMAVQSFWLTN